MSKVFQHVGLEVRLILNSTGRLFECFFLYHVITQIVKFVSMLTVTLITVTGTFCFSKSILFSKQVNRAVFKLMNGSKK